jgi:3-phenylpropionate/trans-cinnamate dioxygenase ferredoxin subunit
MSDAWHDVIRADELDQGGFEVIDVDDTLIAVFNIDNAFYAIEDICTHDGEELTGGPIDNDQIICPRHGARFCLRTGEALTAPAYEPVRTFETRVVDGFIQVRVPG